MEPEGLKCGYDEITIERSLYCRQCTRKYALTGHRHVCGYIPCANEGKVIKYIETYFDQEDTLAKHALCDECERANRRKEQPTRDIMCPRCRYVGRFHHRGDRVCPSCVIVAVVEPAAEIVVAPVDKKECRRTIFLQVNAEGCDRIVEWVIQGQYADSLDDYANIRYFRCSPVLCVAAFTEWCDKLCCDIVWLNTSSLDFRMLQAHLANHGVMIS